MRTVLIILLFTAACYQIFKIFVLPFTRDMEIKQTMTGGKIARESLKSALIAALLILTAFTLADPS